MVGCFVCETPNAIFTGKREFFVNCVSFPTASLLSVFLSDKHLASYTRNALGLIVRRQLLLPDFDQNRNVWTRCTATCCGKFSELREDGQVVTMWRYAAGSSCQQLPPRHASSRCMTRAALTSTVPDDLRKTSTNFF